MYVFICGDGFPYDEHEPDDVDKHELQLQHRARLQTGNQLYTSVGTRDELRNRVYQLQTKVEKLAEELKRSRLWLRRGLAGGLALFILVILGIPFSKDIRDHFRSRAELAVSTLEGKGIAKDVEGLGRALSAASVDDLSLYQDAGISEQLLNTAFAENAAGFFERSRGVPRAIEWLRSALRHGLDPNLVAPHEYYGKEGILDAAMRAGNAEAVIALLDAGASPHPYQSLFLTQADIPRFLFPYDYVLDDDKLTREEKSRIARAFAEAGAVFMTLKDGGPGQWVNYAHGKSIEKVLNEAESVFGFAIPVTPSACQGRSPTPICRAATARTGTDWCKIMQQLPVRVLWKPESCHPDLLRFDLQYLLNVVNGRGYVLVTDTLGPNGGYGLLEISADLRQWYLYKYSGPAVGMGFCKANTDGIVPEDCWRRWSLSYTSGESVVKVSDYYEYEALFDCSKQRPEGR